MWRARNLGQRCGETAENAVLKGPFYGKRTAFSFFAFLPHKLTHQVGHLDNSRILDFAPQVWSASIWFPPVSDVWALCQCVSAAHVAPLHPGWSRPIGSLGLAWVWLFTGSCFEKFCLCVVASWFWIAHAFWSFCALYSLHIIFKPWVTDRRSDPGLAPPPLSSPCRDVSSS